jgi:hypothetical protein
MVCGLVVEGALTRTEKIFRRDRDGRDIYRRRMTIDPFIDLTGGEMIRANPAEVSSQLAPAGRSSAQPLQLRIHPETGRQRDRRYHQIRLQLTGTGGTPPW